MAKRTAEHQLTKDDAERGDGSDDEGQATSQDAPAPPIAERRIRGLPQRKGLGASASGSPAPAPNPFASSSSTPSNPFASFGAPSTSSTPAATAATPSFSFGGASTSTTAPPAAAPKPASAFGGFSFSAPAAAAPKPASLFTSFSFGSSAAASSTPAATAEPVKSAETSANTSKPPAFGGFSATPALPAATKPSSLFSFAAKPAATTEQASQKLETSSTSSTAQPGLPPKSTSSPFAGFSFGGASTVVAQPPADKPVEKAETTPAPAKQPEASKSSAMPQPPTAGFSFGSGAPAPAASSGSSGFAPKAVKLDGMPVPPSGGFAFGSPAPGKAVSNAASTSTSSQPTPAATLATSTSKTTDFPGSNDTHFLTSLRGLNHSLAQAITQKVRSEPFVDLGEVMDRLRDEYDAHLAKIQSKAGLIVVKRRKGKEVKQDGPVLNGTAVESSRSSKTPAVDVEMGLTEAATPQKETTTAPKPTSFGSGHVQASTKVQEPPNSMWTPSQSAGSAGQFVRDILAAKSTERSNDSEKHMSTSTPKRPLEDSTEGSASKRKSAIFSMTPTVKPGGSLFGSPSTVPSTTPSKPALFSPGSFNLGAGSSSGAGFGSSTKPRTASTGFSFGHVEAADDAKIPSSEQRKQTLKDDAPTTTPAPAFSFGQKTGSFDFGKSATSTESASKPAFSFGAPAASSVSLGAPADATNPAASGFSFASTAPKPSAFASSSSAPAFSFGQPVIATPAASSSSTPAPAEETAGEAEEAPSSPPLVASSIASGPAKGEEDETTMWEGPVKLLKRVNKDGRATYSDAQECYMKLNRLKGTGGEEDDTDASLPRRLIVRNAATGRVVRNLSIKNVHAMSPWQQQNAIRLTVLDLANEGVVQLVFAFGKETDSARRAADALKAIQKERRGLGLSDFSVLP